MAYPDDYGLVYEQRKRALAGQRDASLASTAYARFLSTQRGNRSAVDLDINRTRGLGGVTSSFYRRGLGNSGLLRRGRTEYANQWMDERNGIMEALRNQLSQYDLQDAGANAYYNTGVADIEAQKLRDIMATAAALAGRGTGF